MDAIFFVFLEPARAVRGPLMPGDVYDVYAMTRRSLLRSRTEEFQPRCRESDRHEQGCESTQRGVAATIFIVGRRLPAPDAAQVRIKPDRSQSGQLVAVSSMSITLAKESVTIDDNSLQETLTPADRCVPARHRAGLSMEPQQIPG